MTNAGKFAIEASKKTPNTAEDRRGFAVAAALELIAVRVSCATGATQLDYEMSKLSQYADQIQAALEK